MRLRCSRSVWKSMSRSCKVWIWFRSAHLRTALYVALTTRHKPVNPTWHKVAPWEEIANAIQASSQWSRIVTTQMRGGERWKPMTNLTSCKLELLMDLWTWMMIDWASNSQSVRVKTVTCYSRLKSTTTRAKTRKTIYRREVGNSKMPKSTLMNLTRR